MAEMHPYDALQGVLIHDPKIAAATLVESGAMASSYTQANPVPGAPVFQRGDIGVTSSTAGDLGPQIRLLPLGGQTTPKAIRVQRGGMPGVGGAEVAARLRLGGSDHWFGWETENVLGALSAAVLTRGGTDAPRNFDGVDLQDGRVYVVYAEASSITGQVYDGDDHDWSGSAVTIADTSRAMNADGAQQQTAGSDYPVAILRTDSGRLVVARLGLAPGPGIDLVLHYSDDDGATWISSSLAGYDTPLPWTVGRSYDCITMGYYKGRALLLVGFTETSGEDTVRGWVQYASASDAADFKLIETRSAVDATRPHVNVSLDGFFVVTTGEFDTTSYKPTARRIASPFLPLTSADAIEIGGLSSTTMEDTTGWTGPDGTMYVAYTRGEYVQTSFSTDSGVTWKDRATSLVRVVSAQFQRIQAFSMNSRVLWALGFASNPTRGNGPLALLESGGWTMVPNPRETADHPAELRGFGGTSTMTDACTWHAQVAPTAWGWTLTGTGGTVSAGGDWSYQQNAVGEYSRAFGSHSPDDGILIQFGIRTVSSPVGYGSQGIGFEVDLGNGTQDMRVDVRITNAGVGIYDVNGASLIGSASVDCTERRQWKFAMQYDGSGNTVAIYSRLSDGDVWELHVTGSPTRRTSGGGTSAVRWGNVGAGVHDAYWYSFDVTIGDGTGGHTATTDSLAAGLVISQAPYTLPGAPLPVAPGRLHVEEGYYVRGRGGPGLRGDWWECPVGYRQPVTAIDEPSGSRPVRSDTDGVDWRLTWLPSGDATVEHHPGGMALAMFMRSNVRTARWQYWDAFSSAFVTVAELDKANGYTSLPFARVGNRVTVAAGSTADYLATQDLIGSGVNLGSGVLRRVASATGGVWRNGSASITLQLEGVQASDPASGTLTLARRQGMVCALGEVTPRAYWSLLIPSQSTPEGYYQIDEFAVGSLHILGHGWSRSREQAFEPQVEVEDYGGYASVRNLGGTLRQWGVEWSEGVPTYWGDDPSYLKAGGVPIAMRGTTQLAERLAMLMPDDPRVVVAPRIPYDEAASTVEVVQCIGRDRSLYGRLLSAPITVDGSTGVDVRDAVVRTSRVSVRERN